MEEMESGSEYRIRKSINISMYVGDSRENKDEIKKKYEKINVLSVGIREKGEKDEYKLRKMFGGL
jgi:hypothetical protein